MSVIITKYLDCDLFVRYAWGSAWYVMERFLQLYPAIIHILNNKDLSKDKSIAEARALIPSEHDIMTALVFLRPIIQAIQICQSDGYKHTNMMYLKKSLISFYNEYYLNNYSSVFILITLYS